MAEKVYEISLAKGTSEKSLNQEKAEALLKEAKTHFLKCSYKEALEASSEVLSLLPNDIEAQQIKNSSQEQLARSFKIEKKYSGTPAFRFRFIMIGGGSYEAIGISSCLKKFIENKFSSESIATLSVDFSHINILLNQKIYKLEIWDANSHEYREPLVGSYFRNVHGVILMFSITRREDFDNIPKKLEFIKSSAPENAPIILVGNKKDLFHLRKVSYVEGKKLAENIGAIQYIECSAKTGEDVDEVFYTLARKAYERNLQGEIKKPDIKKLEAVSPSAVQNQVEQEKQLEEENSIKEMLRQAEEETRKQEIQRQAEEKHREKEKRARQQEELAKERSVIQENSVTSPMNIAIFSSKNVNEKGLVARFCYNCYLDSEPTIWVEHHRYIKANSKNLRVQFCVNYKDKAHGSALVFDVTDRTTIETLASIAQKLIAKEIPFILLGDHADLANKEVKRKEGEKLAEQLGAIAYFECSAKTGLNVNNAFAMLIKNVIDESNFLQAKENGSRKIAADYRQDYLFKLGLLGYSGAGKSAMLLRFSDDIFHTSFLATMSLDYKTRAIEVNGKSIKLGTWELAGSERFATIGSAYMGIFHGILLLFGLDERVEFDSISTYWLPYIKKYAQDEIPFILVGAKSDMKRAVSQEEGEALAKNIGAISYIEGSAKKDENVEKAFYDLVKSIYDKAVKPFLSAQTSLEPIEIYSRTESERKLAEEERAKARELQRLEEEKRAASEEQARLEKYKKERQRQAEEERQLARARQLESERLAKEEKLAKAREQQRLKEEKQAEEKRQAEERRAAREEQARLEHQKMEEQRWNEHARQLMRRRQAEAERLAKIEAQLATLQVQYGREEYEVALKGTIRLLKNNPDFIPALALKAQCEEKLFQYDEALKTYHLIQQKDSNNKVAKQRITFINEYKKHLAEEARMIRTIIERVIAGIIDGLERVGTSEAIQGISPGSKLETEDRALLMSILGNYLKNKDCIHSEFNDSERTKLVRTLAWFLSKHVKENRGFWGRTVIVNGGDTYHKAEIIKAATEEAICDYKATLLSIQGLDPLLSGTDIMVHHEDLPESASVYGDETASQIEKRQEKPLDSVSVSQGSVALSVYSSQFFTQDKKDIAKYLISRITSKLPSIMSQAKQNRFVLLILDEEDGELRNRALLSTLRVLYRNNFTVDHITKEVRIAGEALEDVQVRRFRKFFDAEYNQELLGALSIQKKAREDTLEVLNKINLDIDELEETLELKKLEDVRARVGALINHTQASSANNIMVEEVKSYRMEMELHYLKKQYEQLPLQLKELQEEMLALREKNELLQTESISAILKAWETSRAREEKVRALLRGVPTKLFYFTLEDGLSWIFLGSKLISHGMVERGYSTTADRVASAIEFFSEVVSLPFASGFTSLVSEGIRKVSDSLEQEKLIKQSNWFSNLDGMSSAVSDIAFELTSMYQDQLSTLAIREDGDCPDAVKLAKLAIGRMLVFLGKLEKPLEDPVEAFILAVRREDADKEGANLALNPRAALVSKKPWVSTKFFSGPGIRTTTPRRRRFSRTEASEPLVGFWKTEVGTYGYSQGSEALAWKFGMKLDS